MKVLLLQGSPRKGGNSELLLKEMVKVFDQYGVESEIVEIGTKDIRGCISCGYCSSHDECVFKDEVNAFAKKFEEADGLVVASPVYYASPNGTVISFLDRLFHSTSFSKRYKVGAAFAIARRGGTTASFDVLNKYFTISGMPVASGDYWNNGFGLNKGEIEKDGFPHGSDRLRKEESPRTPRRGTAGRDPFHQIGKFLLYLKTPLPIIIKPLEAALGV